MKTIQQCHQPVQKITLVVPGHSIKKDELGRPSVKPYSNLFLGYPFYSTKDKTRERFETGKLNAVHAFGNDSLPRHGLYRFHILDPIAFDEDIKVTLQQIGNMIFHYMKDKMMFLVQSLIGIVIIKKDSIKNSQIEEKDSQDSQTGAVTNR